MKFIVSLLLSTISTLVVCANLPNFPLQEGPLLGRSLDCGDVDECEDITPVYDTKICGTNGKTFKSLCEFMRAHCKEGTVNFKSYGECSASEKCLGERKTALNRAKTRKGVFIPECNPDGTFKSVQCHKDTGYCWCSSPLGHAVIGTDTHNDVPDCQNLTNKPPESASTLRPPIWSKGIDPNGGFFVIKTDIDSTPNSARSNRESTDLTTSIEGEVDPDSSSEDKKKQPKHPRGCEGKRRSSFNKNMLKNMVEEFRRENEVADLSGERVLERASLRWKFDELNIRKDNLLRRAEYKGIQKIIRRSFKPRKCAKKFPKFCDKNADKNISLDEWINCFTSGEDENEVFVKGKSFKKKGKKNGNTSNTGKGPVKKKHPCEYERRQAIESGNPDAYVPKCDEDGYFRPVQCYGSNVTNSWYCFCVDVISGDMIESTSMRYGTPNCSVSWPKCPPPDKEEKFLKALRSYFVKYVKEKIFKKHDSKSSSSINDENVLETIFKFIDKNGDNFIERNERRRLKKLIPKKDKRIWTCGRKIHIVCDINGDKKISLQEFLNCVSLRKNNNTVNESFEKKPAPSETRRGKGKTNPFIEVITSA